jgi:RNA polymerase sigma factor (TIGR02999 family)
MSEDERSESIGVEELKNLVGELRMMAHQLLSTESSMHSFTPTALAMTALRRAKLKEQDWTDVRWENRGHFFSALTRAMRNALIDHARHRKARGRGNLLYFPPDESFFFNLPEEADVRPERILLLDEALSRLGTEDQRLAEAVEQYYFLGYSIPEMARFGGISEKTVDRDLKRARTILRKIMETPPGALGL